MIRTLAWGTPRALFLTLSLFALFLTASCASSGGEGDDMPTPPLAPAEPRETTIHGRTLVDDYYWMREREDPRVIAHLEAENAYTEAMSAHLETLRGQLYEEMRGRIKEQDSEPPVRQGDFEYYSRTEEGLEYPIYCRRALGGGEEQILLDPNRLAEGLEYLRVGFLAPSPKGRLLAYSIDDDGSELYTIHVKDLDTGELLAETVENTAPSFAWAADERTFFYTLRDEARRPYRVMRHVLGAGEPDALVFEEPDDRFFVYLGKTLSKEFVTITLESSITSEVHVLEANDPRGEFRVVLPRRQGVEYALAHRGEHFYVLTNQDALDFRVLRMPVHDPARAEEVVAHEEGALIESIEVFEDFMALSRRREGRLGVEILDFASGERHQVPFEEEIYTAWIGDNRVFDAKVLRLGYSSLTTPRTIYDYEPAMRSMTLVKRREVLGGYDPAAYATRRAWAEAADGARVPISLVWRRDRGAEGADGLPSGRPLWLYGYGSYGITIDPAFRSERVSLLERGVVFAIAHVRGSGALGRGWYESGKFLLKKNTFSDFIAAAEHLVARGIANPERIIAQGGSAGGLLMGAVANERPELFAGIVANVPFVDVVNTMLDESIPLTVIEYEEWGNPNERAFFEAMLAYSPYDNVRAQAYPAMLITAGLNDPRVQYWEPAKWSAKLRRHARSDAPILLKTNMGAGHGGASGRFSRLEEIAFEYAFGLDVLGLAER